MRHAAISVLLLLCILLGACRSQRHAAATDSSRALWQSLEVPVKISIASPLSLACSGKATLVRDSSIYVSMRMLGMEVAYIYADADSAIFCDRYHKQYVSEPLDRLLPEEYASIGRIQNMMLGQNIPVIFSDKIELSDSVATPAGTLPSLFELTTTIAGKKINASVLYNYGKARWNEPGTGSQPPRLPRNAEKADTRMLLKALGK